MRLPRNVSGNDSAQALGAFGYTITRHNGSHMRLTTQQRGERHITAPRHDSLRVGTLADILADVAEHFGMSRDQFVERLFGRER